MDKGTKNLLGTIINVGAIIGSLVVIRKCWKAVTTSDQDVIRYKNKEVRNKIPINDVMPRVKVFAQMSSSFKPADFDKDLTDVANIRRNEMVELLHEEDSLLEVVKLIGSDVLPEDQKLTLEIARVVRVGYLQQNAFHKDDTCVPIEKQAAQMRVILYLYDRARSLVTMGHPMSVLKQSNIFDRVINIKYDVPNDRLDMFDQYMKDIDTFYDEVIEKNA